MKMHRKVLAEASLFFAVFALALFAYFSPAAVPDSSERQGKVLGESVAFGEDEAQFKLFIAGLLSKRKEYGDTNCDFVVREDSDSGAQSWEGNLIWNTAENYKLFVDKNAKIYSVNSGNLYQVLEGMPKEAFGNIREGDSGFAKFSEIRNYVFEDFLGDVAKHPEGSRLRGEEMIDGARYFILESDIFVADPKQEIKRRFYVSEEGVFLKGTIEDRVEDYEVYDSAGAAVTQKGYMKKIDIEVGKRVFF